MPAQTQMLGDRALSGWLEFLAPDSGEPRRATLEEFPFTIGRNPDVSLPIDSHRVSRAHAELSLSDDGLSIRDLGSTNGTFVNGRRITGPQPLEDGDLILIADIELTFCRGDRETGRRTATLAMDAVAELDRNSTASAGELISQVRRLQELLTHAAIPLLWQPIGEITDREAFAWRVELQVTRVDDRSLLRLLALPGRLPALARDLFRERAVAGLTAAGSARRLLVPVWKEDLHDLSLLERLRHWARHLPPPVRLVAEVRAAEVEPDELEHFTAGLREARLELALAGFAGGRAQLEAWSSTGPEYVLLDERVTRDLSLAGGRSRQLAGLAAACGKWRGRLIAGGPLDPATAEACRQAGCDWETGEPRREPTPGNERRAAGAGS